MIFHTEYTSTTTRVCDFLQTPEEDPPEERAAKKEKARW
jgi:hypothetical protein